MENVVQVADRAGDASRTILSDATEIGAESERLRQEVEQFLNAVKTDTGERRKFERIAGNGVTATVRLPGAAAVKAVILDLSPSGISLRHGGTVAVGRDVEIDLPDAGGPVTGCVSRAGDGVVVVTFKADPAARGRIDRALASLSAARKAA
jgi:methyl-accepting chemotaxis protein